MVFVKDSYQYTVFRENIWFGVNFFVSIIPMGIIISWFCAKNRKSVIAAILFHFIINICQEILAITQITKCIETAVLAVIAAAVVALDREVFARRRPQAESAGGARGRGLPPLWEMESAIPTMPAKGSRTTL